MVCVRSRPQLLIRIDSTYLKTACFRFCKSVQRASLCGNAIGANVPFSCIMIKRNVNRFCDCVLLLLEVEAKERKIELEKDGRVAKCF